MCSGIVINVNVCVIVNMKWYILQIINTWSLEYP